MSAEALGKAVAAYKDWSKVAVFGEDGKAIFASWTADEKELKAFVGAFEDRDTTFGKGLILDKEHFEVHRWYPGVTYGRRGKPGNSQGICVVQEKNTKSQKALYVVCTWGGYATSARIVAEAQEFSKKFVATI